MPSNTITKQFTGLSANNQHIMLRDLTTLYNTNRVSDLLTLKLHPKEPKVLKSVQLFHTPKTTEELMTRINELNGSEQAIAMTYAMFSWNLACYLTNEEETND